MLDLNYGYDETELENKTENNEENFAYDANNNSYYNDLTELADEDYGSLVHKQPGRANIVVVGIGGGGNNAVNNMILDEIQSASFIAMNTDLQALNMSIVPLNNKIQIGIKQTGGLGAGSNPEIGKASAEESRETIKKALRGIDMLFIAAGMGGGTGTGAAPIVAEIAKELGILTVAVVTKPFGFEGVQRKKNAEEGIKNLKKFVDTLLVVPNEKLIEVLGNSVTCKKAYEAADRVLCDCVKGVSDIIAKPELINLDFADIKTILSNKGYAHMGIGRGKGENRIREAVRSAVYSPLLETDIEGATGIIVNICGGEDMLLSEVSEACTLIREVVDPTANIIFGSAYNATSPEITITVIATGFADKNSNTIKPSLDKMPFSVAAALADVASDIDRRPSVEETLNPEEFSQYQRPVFSRQTPSSVQPEGHAMQNNAAPALSQQQKPQAEQPIVRPSVSSESDIKTSRIDVTSKQVPAFLRRLRGNKE